MAEKEKKFNSTLAENRKARHDYTVLEDLECGIQLTGTEVKSVRRGGVSLAGSYGAVLKGELWLVGADIAAYEFGNRFNHDPKRNRKLLVHAKEVRELRMKTEAKGLTLVPLKLFLKHGKVKVSLGICRGKQLHDKREALKKKALRDVLAGLLIFFAAPWIRAETHILECERFRDLGGWKIESQYHAQLGSSHLIAHGLGRPVANASTTFAVSSGGVYRAYVLTKNWTAPWSPHVPGAGRFHLIVNGKTVPKPLGDTGNAAWRWQYVDAVALKPGENAVALRDATGFDGRVDAVCFTTETEAPDMLRQKGIGVAAVPAEVSRQFDLVVAGGGVAGITAAISAARLGLKVALVQNRPILGGNNSSEVRVHLGGWCNVPPYPRLGDVVAEIAPAHGGNAERAANYEDDRKHMAVNAETNIVLFLNTNIEAVETVREKEGLRIVSATGVDVVTGAATRFVAPLFADCTGDACVGQLAGASFHSGREARATFGEPSAPMKGDAMTMGASVQWNTRTRTSPIPFPTEPWMIPLDDTNAHATRKGDWNWETGMGRDAIRDAEEIRDYGLLVAYSNWAQVKNSTKSGKAFANVELDWVAQVAGKRESRRLVGDFTLTENHLIGRQEQPDGTCATTWTIDLHEPQTVAQSHFTGIPFLSNSSNICIYPYPIPYRCLYSKDVMNLFMAGRDISVTHVALGTTRLMRTCGMMGEVVGMAAQICTARRCLPRAVYTHHFDALKVLMTRGVGKGGKNPPQTYNNQRSLDAEIGQKYMRATQGR